MQTLQTFVRDEVGATSIEYGLIASLIAMAIIGTATLVGSKMESMYEDIIAASLP